MVERQSGARRDHPRSGARGDGFFLGLLAALLMTAVMAALRLTTDVLSLPEILGETFITVMPAPMFSAILDVLQRAAKPTLYVGIFVGQLVVGGLLGRWYLAGEPTWRRALKLALVVWLVVGGLALPVVGAGLFGSAVRAGGLVVGTQLLVAFVSFAASLVLLGRALAPAAATRGGARASRRTALATLAGGVAAVAAGGYAWRTLLGGANRPTAAAPEAVAGASGGATATGPTDAGAGAGDAAPAVFDVPGSQPAATAVDPIAGASPATSGAPGTGPRRGIPPLDAPSVSMTVAPGTAAPAPFNIPNLAPEVMAAGDFYTVSKNLLDPRIDGASWKLTIDGLVERPTTLALADVAALPSHSDYYTLLCISNTVGGDLWGNAHWKGVRLVDLLAATGLRPGVRKVVFHAEDGYTDSVLLDAALRPDTLLAYEMNGEALTKEHGFPARLLIPGIYGMKNVKWITRIELVDYDFKGYWMQRGWSDRAPYQTSSRIDVPRSRATPTVGELAIAGVAFAGDRGIDNIEVSLDDGRTWRVAELKPSLGTNAWNLWALTVTLDAGTYPLKVRATDGTGEIQPARDTDPLPNGATGWHSALIRVG